MTHDINDFVVFLKIIEQGYRGILENQAFCIEETARDTEGEFNRQVRFTNRTIRAMVNNKALLNPIKFPLFSSLTLQKSKMLQIQGAEGEAVVIYCEPLATLEMRHLRLSLLGK